MILATVEDNIVAWHKLARQCWGGIIAVLDHDSVARGHDKDGGCGCDTPEAPILFFVPLNVHNFNSGAVCAAVSDQVPNSHVFCKYALTGLQLKDRAWNKALVSCS